MPNLTDEQFEKLLAARGPIQAPAPEPVLPKTMQSNAIEMLFRGLTGICATGIGWLVITMPVMRENIKDLKEDVSKIEANTKDRFTRQDFNREIESIQDGIARNSALLDDRSTFIRETRERLTKLEQQLKEN